MTRQTPCVKSIKYNGEMKEGERENSATSEQVCWCVWTKHIRDWKSVIRRYVSDFGDERGKGKGVNAYRKK